MTTRISDLPTELVEKILTRTPITSLKAVRSTSKLWNTCLTKDWILGKEAAMQQFVGFMTMDSKVCSIRFDLCRKEDEDLIDLSIKQVDILNQFEISKVFHCDGLLLCVAKNNSRLLVWNPYLGQTKWIGIGLRTNFHILYNYAFGYDINCNHKILRSLYDTRNDKYMYQIHDLSSESWKVLDVTPTWKIQSYQRCASLKGNTYFLAFGKIKKHGVKIFFLLCFDFTRERFGPRLPLPFHSAYIRDTVTLSCVRKEHLAVLYQENKVSFNILQIWVTTRIEPNDVSWSKFLNVEMRPFELTGVRFNEEAGSFFIIEEEKVAVVFDVDRYLNTDTARYHTAFIIGEDGYFKSVSLGEAPAERCPTSRRSIICPPLVCSSSYLPSLVQLNKPRKRKEKDY